MSTSPCQISMVKDVRVCGCLLVAIPLFSLIVLAHHPTVTASNLHGVGHELSSAALAAKVVHGTLIAMQCALLYAFSSWLITRNLQRAIPRATGIMLMLGVIGVIGAALVDGFVVSPVSSYPHDGDPSLFVMGQLLRFAMTLNQVLILAGELALSAAFALLSIDLFGLNREGRFLGALGLLLGIGSLVALLSGWLTLQLHGMQFLFAAQSMWMLCFGIFMLRLPEALLRRESFPLK